MGMKVGILPSTQTLWKAEDFLSFLKDFASEGLANTSGNGTDLKVTQRALGANMSVDVATGVYYKSVTISGRTWKVRAENLALLNLAIGANVSGSNRIDAVVLKLNLSVDPDASASNVGSIVVVPGTGITALTDGAITTAVGHANWVRLANVTVANAAASILDASITNLPTPMIIGSNTSGYKTKFTGDGSLLENLVFNATAAHVVNLPETASSGIVAGNAVYVKSNGQVTKNATVKTFKSIDEYILLSGNGAYSTDAPRVAWLRKDKFIVSWRQRTGTSTYQFVSAVGTMDKYGEVSIWSERNWGGNTGDFAITPVSESYFVATYLSSSGNVSNYLVTLDVDNNMTFGSDQAVATESSQYAICRISDTEVMIVTRDATTDDCFARIGTISGGALSWGSTTTMDTGVTQNFSCVRLSNTKAIVVWGVTGSISARVANIAAGAITAGAGSYTMQGAGPVQSFLARVTDTSFIGVFNSTTATSGNVQAIGATVAGDVITFGSPITIGTYSNSSGAKGACSFNENGAMALFNENNSFGSNVYLCYITLTGTTVVRANIVNVTITGYAADAQGHNNNMTLIQGKIVVGFISYGNSGTAAVPGGVLRVFKPIFNEKFAGIAKAAPTGSTVDVITQGVTGGLLSGLTIGTAYYAKSDGTISDEGLIEIGEAIKTTDIILRPAV